MKWAAWDGGSVARQKELGKVSERSETFSQFSKIIIIIIVKKKNRSTIQHLLSIMCQPCSKNFMYIDSFNADGDSVK